MSSVSLVESIVAGRLEDGLYQTCELLMADNVIALENAWVASVSRLGDVEGINAVTWFSICQDMLATCDSSDGIRVKEALLLTGKLCLLSRQLAGSVGLGVGVGIHSVAALRSKVIGYFPENGMRLSQRGVAKFGRLLPVKEEERLFAERLLVGLSQLWEEHGQNDLPPAMEYLFRKKQLVLHCSSIGKQELWPYPSLDESDKGDIVWFLWGAWMLMFDWAKVLWRLFCLNYKRSFRNERKGLLMACHGMQSLPLGHHNQSWGPIELSALEYIEENASAMWKEATTCNKNYVKQQSQSQQNRQPLQQTPLSSEGAENIWNYVPRGQSQAPKENDDEEKGSRSLGLKQARDKKPTFDALAYPSHTRNRGEHSRQTWA